MFEDSETGRLVASYGYLAVLFGTMLEGETVVLVAGFLAHQGHLSIPWIILFAIIGSSISDQGIFFLTRLRGAGFLRRFPKAEAKVRAMSDRMRSRPVALTLFALFFRFFYGLRNIAPIFLGLSSIPTLRFVCLNAIGAVLWAVLFSLGGWWFARALSAISDNLAKYELIFAALLLVAGVGFHLYHRLREAKRNDEGDAGGSHDGA